MKRLLIPALLFSLAAWAQEVERDANPTENAWFKLQILTNDQPDFVAEHLKSHGVTVENLEALRTYVAKSEQELTALSQKKANTSATTARSSRTIVKH